MRRKFVGKAPDAADPRGLCITPSMQSTICGPREPSPHYLRPVAPMLVSLPPALAMTSSIGFGPQGAQPEQSIVSSSNSMAMERSLACLDGQPHLLGQVDLSLVAFLRLCCPPVTGMVEETSWWEFYFVSFFHLGLAKERRTVAVAATFAGVTLLYKLDESGEDCTLSG